MSGYQQADWQGGHWKSVSNHLEHQHPCPRYLYISSMKQTIFGPNSSGLTKTCFCLFMQLKFCSLLSISRSLVRSLLYITHGVQKGFLLGLNPIQSLFSYTSDQQHTSDRKWLHTAYRKKPHLLKKGWIIHSLDYQVKYPACCAPPYPSLFPNHILLMIELVKGHINLNGRCDGFLMCQLS